MPAVDTTFGVPSEIGLGIPRRLGHLKRNIERERRCIRALVSYAGGDDISLSLEAYPNDYRDRMVSTMAYWRGHDPGPDRRVVVSLWRAAWRLVDRKGERA